MSESTFFSVNVSNSQHRLYAKISPEDAALILLYKWDVTFSEEDANQRFYARSIDRETGKTVRMHRLIMSAPDGVLVDHINGDTLDNRRSNLRLATNRQNCINAVKRKAGTSVFKGVSWHKESRKWRAYIAPDRKAMHLGLFLSEEEAARAYDAKARELFGAFANCNFNPPALTPA